MALLPLQHHACHRWQGQGSVALTWSLSLWRCSPDREIQIVLHEKQLSQKKKPISQRRESRPLQISSTGHMQILHPPDLEPTDRRTPSTTGHQPQGRRRSHPPLLTPPAACNSLSALQQFSLRRGAELQVHPATPQQGAG